MAIYSGNTLVATKGGVSNYSDLDNKPSINDVILVGNKTLDDLNIASKDSIPVSTSQLTNDSGFITTIPEEYVTNTELEAKNYVTTSSLATVATSGLYADITNKPQINSITLDGNKTLTELGIAASSDLSTIATSGSYNDAENKPQINSVELTGNKTSEELSLQDLDTALNYNNITNCITKIPQDIKLELDNGTLTLKSGSKVYNADGTVYTLDNDLSMTPEWGAVSGTTTNIVVFPTISNNKITGMDAMNLTRVFSGDTAPTFPDNYACWLDTTINKVKYTNNGGTTWTENRALPLCLVSTTDHVVTSIDQVFNGMGFIGSCVYMLPGVEGLCPNGLKDNGTYNNIIRNVPNIFISDIGSNTGTYIVQVISNGLLFPNNNYYKIFYNKYEVLEFAKTIIGNFDCYIVNENKQYYYNHETNTFSENIRFNAAIFESINGKIISFKPYLSFAAVNINQIEQIVTDIPISIYQKIVDVEDVRIMLYNNASIYKLNNITSSMSIIFNSSALNKNYSDRVITFELYIPVSSTVPTITWPTGVVWLAEETPTFEANTNYLLAFRSFDQGVNWIGNMQCSWPNA